MSEIVDDKSEHCIPFILQRLEEHKKRHGRSVPPFFVGLNGVQGAGKTTLVETLCATLASEPYNLPTVVLSIDDLYLPHEQQTTLARFHPKNPLVQHRGQPSTHDVPLGVSLFQSIKERKSNIKIPSYDKSAFNGHGDRRDQSQWHVVNSDPAGRKIEVVVFEGWCVGFRPLRDESLEKKWRGAKAAAEDPSGNYQGCLGKLSFDNVKFVNEALKEYDQMTDQLDVFMHIDAADPQYVYEWRRQQEVALREAKGTGMTDEQVVDFVNGYYPAYELYTEQLRSGIYNESGKQIRLVVGQDRRVKEVHKL